MSLGSRANFGGQMTGEQYRKTIEAPFFEMYLKGKPGFDLKDTASFRTGVNQWERIRCVAAEGGVSAKRSCI